MEPSKTFIEWLALGIAIYAALVATVGALWQLRSWWSDRPRVRVEIRYGFTTHTSAILMTLRAINTGRQSAHLTNTGLGLKSGHNLFSLNNPPDVPQIQLPHELKPGTRYEVYFDLQFVLEALSKENNGQVPQTGWFDDATGKRYVGKVRSKHFKTWSERAKK